MEDMIEEVKTTLLQTIIDAIEAQDVLDAIHNFTEFLNALSIEEEMKRHGEKA